MDALSGVEPSTGRVATRVRFAGPESNRIMI